MTRLGAFGVLVTEKLEGGKLAEGIESKNKEIKWVVRNLVRLGGA